MTPLVAAAIESWRAELAAFDELTAAEEARIYWRTATDKRPRDEDGLVEPCPTTSEEQVAVDKAMESFEEAVRAAMPDIIAWAELLALAEGAEPFKAIFEEGMVDRFDAGIVTAQIHAYIRHDDERRPLVEAHRRARREMIARLLSTALKLMEGTHGPL